MADFDPDAWLAKRQQQKQQTPPEAPKSDFDPDAWLRQRGTPGALSAAGPPTVMGAPDPVGKYVPGFARGAAQSVVGGGAALARGAEAVRGIPYAGPAIAQFPLTRPLFDIAKSVSPEQKEEAAKFGAEPYKLPGQQAGYWAGEAAQLLPNPSHAFSMAPEAVKTVSKIALTEGAWHAAGYLSSHVLPPGVGSTYLIYRFIKDFGVKRAMKFFSDVGNLPKDVKALREELAGAKGAGTVIPKAAESTGAKVAKTQAKFTPKEPKEMPGTGERTTTKGQPGPGSTDFAAKIQRGEVTSADIAAAKLAKRTGAYRPEDKDYIDALSKLPLPAK